MAGPGGEATVEPSYSLLVAGVCPLVNETGNWGLWLEGSGCLRSSARWSVSLGHEPSRGAPEALVGSEGLMAASLLEGGAGATPSYLLDPKHPSNGAHRAVQGWLLGLMN